MPTITRMCRQVLKGLMGSMLVAGANVAWAVPIQYVYTGTASGSVDGTPFAEAAFTVLADADTDHVTTWFAGTLQNTHASATLTLAGFGAGSFTRASQTWIAENCCMGLGENFSINWLNLPSSALTGVGWNMKTAIGPVLDPAASTQGQFVNVGTSFGRVTFDAVSDVTFQAVLVPEPASVVLMLVGLAGLASLGRRQPD